MKLSKKIILNFIIIILLLASLTLVYRIRLLSLKKTSNELTIMIRDNSEEIGQNELRKGIEQALLEVGKEESLIVIDNLSVEEQLLELEKEKSNGTEGILIEPLSDKRLENKLMSLGKELPVIQINSSVSNNSELKLISLDNREMGRQLAINMSTNNDRTANPILLLTEGELFSDEKFKVEGIVEILNKEGYTFQKKVITSTKLSELSSFIDKETSIIVTTSLPVLEKLGEINHARNEKLPHHVYGFGKNNRVIKYLENKEIEGIIVSNDYSLGYLSTRLLLDGQPFETGEKNFDDFNFITYQTMFNFRNERLLFPFTE